MARQANNRESGTAMVTVGNLFVYPVKSCRGVELEQSVVQETGLAHDREWMIVAPDGRFLTQREVPQLARVEVRIEGRDLVLARDGAGTVAVALDWPGPRVEVTVWRDRCAAIDQGDAAARWLGEVLGRDVRLVRFDPAWRRRSDPAWTGDAAGYAQFSDGYAMLALSRASLADLNGRLSRPLPMNRFRPNLVLDGLPPYGEDGLRDLVADGLRLRVVKPCTRCRITTTDQGTGEVDGEEPLRTLRTYRWDAALRGVAFGQNVIVVAGAGCSLRKGQELRVVAAVTPDGGRAGSQ